MKRDDAGMVEAGVALAGVGAEEGAAAVGHVAPPLLSLAEVSLRYQGVTALDRLSLTVHRGERLMLIGANGSGKSSLLRVLHGLQAHEGQRCLHELVQDGERPRPPRIAMLFQRPYLMRLTVQANLRLALWLAGVPAADRPARTVEALERVGLQAQAGQAARTLSGGQQQRLALARAWAIRPDLLLLDEPTASLDPGAKREVEALIGDFAAQGMSLVMSTHNLGQAKRLATRIVYLDGGRILADRPVTHFFNDPLPREAALFLKGELPWT